jgi:hypothetical protein
LVFMTLIKFKILDFFKGFKEGFMATLGVAWKILSPVVSLIGKMFTMFGGKNLSDTEKLGKALGTITAALLVWKGVSTVAYPMVNGLKKLGNLVGGKAAATAEAEVALRTGNFTYVWVLNMGAGMTGGPLPGGLPGAGKFALPAAAMTGLQATGGIAGLAALGYAGVKVLDASVAGNMSQKDFQKLNYNPSYGGYDVNGNFSRTITRDSIPMQINPATGKFAPQPIQEGEKLKEIEWMKDPAKVAEFQKKYKETQAATNVTLPGAQINLVLPKDYKGTPQDTAQMLENMRTAINKFNSTSGK